MGMRRPRHELHIEELVLQGRAGAGAGRIRDALERELAQLLKIRRAPTAAQTGGDEMDAGKLTLTPAADGDQVGSRLARQVHASLGGRTEEQTSTRRPVKSAPVNAGGRKRP